MTAGDENSRALIGVGGLVLNRVGQMLLVRGTFGPQRGQWHFPGGKVEPGELIHHAVAREVKEEAGIDAEVLGLVAVRHRLRCGPLLTPLYLIFALQATDETQEPRPDGTECDAAAWFTPAEIAQLPNILAVTRAVALRHGPGELLREVELPGLSGAEWVVFT